MCDYIQQDLYPADINGINCNLLGNAPYSLPSLINHCYYDRTTNKYKLLSCTNTISNTFYYDKPDCSGTPYTFQTIDECDHGSTDEYIKIQKCTTPMNHISDKCGYVQLRKNYAIDPLDECIESSDTFSYLWKCHSSKPSLYYWNSNTCGDLTTADANFTVTPISFSCSSNKCSHMKLQTYSTNNCQITDNTPSKTRPYIIDTCFNWFNDNNNMVSEIYNCYQNSNGQNIFYGIGYNKPNCDDSYGSHVIFNLTEQCQLNSTNRYIIQCDNISLIPINTSTTTNPRSTTLNLNITALSTSFQTTSFQTTPSSTLKNERVFYVSSTGKDSCSGTVNIQGGTEPCGTLRQAVSVASFAVGYYNISKVEIIVQGQNPTEIKDYIDRIGTNPCIPGVLNTYITYFEEITITFDPNFIHNMQDWYDKDLCESGTKSSKGFFAQHINANYGIIINNLIFDSYIFEGRTSQPFYIVYIDTFTCNHCIFSNIIISSDHHILDTYNQNNHEQFPSLIVSSVMKFSHSKFENIIYILSSDSYEYDYSFIHVKLVTEINQDVESFGVTMIDSSVTNIDKLNRFIDIYMYAAFGIPKGQFLITNSTFDNIFLFDTIFYHNPYTLGGSTNFIISNCDFFNLNLGSILHVGDGKLFITLSDINITTPQTIQNFIATKQSFGIIDTIDDYSLFIFESKIDIINIRDVNIEYLYGHYLSQNCNSDDRIEWAITWGLIEKHYMRKDLDFIYFIFHCAIPIQFMHTLGTVDITYLSVSNDITDILVEEYKQFIIDEIQSLPGHIKDTIYINLQYLFEENTGFIYNDGGELSIEYFYVYGIGVHDYIIFNPNGDLSINQMIAKPETYCTVTPCTYDRDALQIGTWVRFSAGDSKCSSDEFRITNSYLYGSADQSIIVGSGYGYLHNITVDTAGMGIGADADCVYLEIISSQFIDIGPYYSASRYFLNAYDDILSPFVLLSSELFIKDTIFSYIAPYQFNFFGTERWFNIVAESDTTRRITLINNIFEINDQNVVRPYPTNHSMHYLDEIDWERAAVDENYTVEIDLNKYFLLNGTMEIKDDVDITMINNEFRINENNLYVNETTLTDIDIPWIYINNTDGLICMSGNQFTNKAIHIYNGNVTSCVKPELLQYFDVEDCNSYGTFGSSVINNNHGQPNVFNINDNNVESIIIAEANSYIGLDNNIIHIKNTFNHTDLLHIMNGNYLFVDTIINSSSHHDIKINEHCDVNCYSIVNNDFNLISTLHVMCENTSDTFNNTVSIHEISEVQYKSHWSPYLIKIVPHNNGSYVPGEALSLNYSIYDEYNNIIDVVNQEFILNFKSTNPEHLISSFQLVINSDGICTECRNGISFSAVTLDMVNQTYTFSGSVANNFANINDLLTITVKSCPSGYGASGTRGLCDACARGYVNLVPTEEPCYYCNENEIDGITCPGLDSIIVDYNYWVMVYQFSKMDNDVFASDYIVSSKCAGQYCCQLENGCDLMHDSEFLCAANRDFGTALCGQCLPGFSEVYGTTKCMRCDAYYVLRLLVPILYGLGWALFILITKTSKVKKSENLALESNDSKCNCNCTQKLKTLCCCCVSNEDGKQPKKDVLTRDKYLNSLEVMVSKIILYYYQSISYILTTSEMQSNLYGFIELSNLNILLFIKFDDDDEGYCLLKNMTA
eukprot:494129_1